MITENWIDYIHQNFQEKTVGCVTVTGGLNFTK